MVFNGDLDGQDLCTLADDLVNSSSVTYPLQAKTRAANKTVRKIWSWIFSAYGGWQFDDSNNTTSLPVAVANLAASQEDYDVPPTALTIRGVEILPQNGTLYQPLIEITEEDLQNGSIAEGSFMSNPGQPMYYRPIGNSIKLYPAANYVKSNGLRVTFDRGSVSFVSTDTTKQPGFASEFHEAVAVGMGLEFSRRNSLASFTFLQDDMNRFEKDIKAYYASRFREKYPAKIQVQDLSRDYR